MQLHSLGDDGSQTNRMSSTPLLLRSMHFVPGPNERMLSKALDSDADALILDLEDAVPANQKGNARKVISSWLQDRPFKSKATFVRINPFASPWGKDDLLACLRAPPTGFLVPKVETATELEVLDKVIRETESADQDGVCNVGFVPINTETARAALLLPQLTNAPRLTAMTWGAEDLMSNIGASRNRDEHGNYFSLYESCRNQTLLAATVAGVPAIDTVFTDLNDLEGLKQECRYAADLGFLGKLTIHPAQIDIVNAAFTPSIELVAECNRLVEAFTEAKKQGLNAIRFEGRMVDEPHLRQAERMIERARLVSSRERKNN